MKKILASFLLVISLHGFSQETYLIVGTYTSGKSEGIYVYKFNSLTAESSFVSSIKTANPSFLTVSNDQQFVYAVSETADSSGNYIGGKVNAFSFDKATGKLALMNSQKSGGKNPCYVSIDATGRWIFTGNYTSGTFGLIPVSNDGSLLPLKKTIVHQGAGPILARQATPHVHATVIAPGNKYLYVPDLGIDKVMVYRFKEKAGKIKYHSAAASTPGSGPRHFEIHPNNKYAYLMEEITGTVVCYKIKKGKLSVQQRISALASNFKGVIGSADIHVAPDGNFLYCSNRGESNTISIFSINQENGTLTFIKEQSTLGIKPRNFNFHPTGNFLLVANQNSDNIIIFKVNKQTGLLEDTGKRINVFNPVCIKWIR